MAVWSTSIDSQALAFGLAVFLTGSLMLPSTAASKVEDVWWFDSCSISAHTRHSRSTHSVVEHQIVLVISNLDNTIKKDIESLFPKMKYVNKNFVVKYPWLKNNAFLQKMKKDSSNALGVFHQALQKYAGTMYKLKHNMLIDSNGTAFDNEKRLRTLKKISDEMKRLLCEIETELEFRNLTVPKKIKLEEMRIALPEVVDVTRGSVEYLNILKKYRTFLKKSKRILFPKKRRKTKGKIPQKKIAPVKVNFTKNKRKSLRNSIKS